MGNIFIGCDNLSHVRGSRIVILIKIVAGTILRSLYRCTDTVSATKERKI